MMKQMQKKSNVNLKAVRQKMTTDFDHDTDLSISDKMPCKSTSVRLLLFFFPDKLETYNVKKCL